MPLRARQTVEKILLVIKRIKSIICRNYPRIYWDTWIDLIAFRSLAKLFKPKSADAVVEHGHALIICLGFWPFSLKVEGMFAHAMRLAGWRVTFLLPYSRWSMAAAYLRVFGFNLIYSWEEFSSKKISRHQIFREADALLASVTSFSELKSLTFRGCWVGPQILSSVSRNIRQAKFDLSDAATMSQIRRITRIVIENVFKAESVISSLNPDLVLANETNYAHFGPLVDVSILARKRVIQYIQPTQDDAFYCWALNMKTRRQHPTSLSRTSFARIQKMEWTPRHEANLQRHLDDRYGGKWFLQRRNQPGVSRMGKHQIIDSLDLDPSRKIVCVFSHLLWDANLFYGEDLFEDYGDWFVSVVKAACANDNVNWLIKYHPVNLWKRKFEGIKEELTETKLIRQHIGAVPAHIKLLPPDCSISTSSLFNAIDAATTVRGTIGLELPCFGVPVLTAGTGRYAGQGFTFDSSSRDEYLSRLANVQNISGLTPEQILLAKKHAYGVFCMRTWKMRSFRADFRPPRYPGDPIAQQLHPVVNSLGDISRMDDLRMWSQWAIHGDSPDYIDWAYEFEPEEPARNLVFTEQKPYN